MKLAELKARLLANPGVASAYAEADGEFRVIEAMILARSEAGVDARGGGPADGIDAIGSGAAGGRAGVADGRDAAEICGGGGEAVTGGDGVRG